MKNSAKIFKIVSIFASFVFFFLLSTINVKAIYDADLNKVVEYKVDRAADKVTMTVQYQYGLKDLEVYICIGNAPETCTTIGGTTFLTKFVDSALTEPNKGIVNRGNDVTTYYDDNGYSNPEAGKRLSEYSDRYDSDGKLNNTYTIMVKASFCTTRNTAKTECVKWTSSTLILNEKFDISSGLTSSSELNTTIGKILNITNSIVIPILWVALGVLLIVRGILLSIDIVKSSDEPEVRKKKINGLVWLVVGVLIGYIVTIAARIVMDMFGYGGYF